MNRSRYSTNMEWEIFSGHINVFSGDDKMKTHKLKLLIGILGVFAAQSTFAATMKITDTIDANSSFENNYFVPDDSLKYTQPYYRGWNKDWGWQHNPIEGNFTSANLNISAFDVDFSKGEVDEIYAWNNQSSDWELQGSLAGADDIFSFTNFSLGSSWFDEIKEGLKVTMDIATQSKYWVVTLAKSSLSIDGGELPPPIPEVEMSEIPIPAAIWLFAPVLAGFMGLRRQAKQ